MPSEKSCGAVIFKTNGKRKYLLLHYEGGHWDFVKGHVERNESERQTVLRETQEETGLTELTFLEGYRKPINYYYKRAGETVYKEVVFYLLESKTDSIRLSREHVGFVWMSYDIARERLTYKNAKETLRKAHEYLEKLQARALIGDAEKSS
ncbi:MAG: NUDIX domain-containing protein [Candidatus Bathyarchaeia archaeon]|jgi:8-oxo-dGTP pyrophosphatase MutT (NUDIX family)